MDHDCGREPETLGSPTASLLRKCTALCEF